MQIDRPGQIASERILLNGRKVAFPDLVVIPSSAPYHNIDVMFSRCSIEFVPVVVGNNTFVLWVLEKVSVELEIVHVFHSDPTLLFFMESVLVCVSAGKPSGVSSLAEVQVGWKLNAD